MHLNEWSLREPAGRAARVAALELLVKVRETRDRLDDARDDEALHDFRVSVRRLRSWLRAFQPVLHDTLSSKTAGRLKRIARATGSSRDLEVHLVWVEERRRALRGEQLRGAAWLTARLRARKIAADLELRQIVNAEFDRATKRIESAMSTYSAQVVEEEPRFAAVTARLVRRQASSLAKALKAVSTIGDRAEAHVARIAAKRLRYLLDPLDHALPDVKAIVDELGELQDRLGQLHDAQLFGSEIATAVAELLADQANAGATPGDAHAKGASATDHDDPVPGLLAFARRLRRAEETAYAGARESWLEDDAAALLGRVGAVAAAIDQIARQGRETRRRYVLRAMPEDMPAASVVAVDTGYVPGARIVERIRREQRDDGTTYYRIVKAGAGPEQIELVEETTERVFDALWPLTKGSRVRTRKHRVDTDAESWDILEFLDRELFMAVVEVDPDESAPAIPEWLEAAVERDATDDDAYGGRQLAK